MAAPVIPDPTFSALYDDATKWTHPTLDYEYYTDRVGAPAAMAAEKLAGWSVFLDLFHGPNHAIALAVRRSINEITPGLHCTFREYSHEPHQRLNSTIWVRLTIAVKINLCDG